MRTQSVKHSIRGTRFYETKLRPLTARGAAFAFLAMAVFALGAARAELAALLWGSAFLFLFVAAVLLNLVWTAGLVAKLARMTDLPAALPVSLVVESGEYVTIRLLRMGGVASRVPGVTVLARLDWDWRGFRSGWAEYEISGAWENAVRVLLPGRGNYTMVFSLVVRDSLGFTRLRVEPDTEVRHIVVLPHPAGRTPTIPSLYDTGRDVPDPRERVRGEDLLEVRKYVPGDDPRRINWKLFARFEELFIRMNEEVPRSRGRVMVMLYVGDPATFEGRAAATRFRGAALERVDGCCSIVQRLVSELNRRNIACGVLLPRRANDTRDRAAEDELRIRLSEVAPGAPPPDIPSEPLPQVLLVLPVGVRRSEDNPVYELARRRASVGIYLVSGPAGGHWQTRENAGGVRETSVRAGAGDLHRLASGDMLEYRSVLGRNSYVELV